MCKIVHIAATTVAIIALLALSGCTAGLDNEISSSSSDSSEGGGGEEVVVEGAITAPTAVEIDAHSSGKRSGRKTGSI